MVGVPGRSKACNTCRKRKKGCDLQRPVCGQCRKACIPCEGYERQRIFVNANQHTGPRAATRNQGDVTLPHTLARTAYEDKYMGLFWEAYLPNGRSFPASVAQFSNVGWTNSVRELYPNDPSLRKALLSLSLATIGIQDNQTWMKRDALKLYVAAIQNMAGELQKPSQPDVSALLAASRMLGFYELLCGGDEHDCMSQATSWRSHSVGEMALIASRPPSMFTDGHAHELFTSGRVHLVFSNMLQRKRSALSNNEWKTLPWANTPKTTKDVLVDIFVDIPWILEEQDKFRNCKDPELREILREELLGRCWEYDARLVEWKTTNGPHIDIEKLSTSAAVSTDDLVAVGNMSLWAGSCLLLYTAMHQTADPSDKLPAHTDPYIYCEWIAKALKVLFLPSTGTWATQLVPFPMGMALNYLAAMPGGMLSEPWKIIKTFFDMPGHPGAVAKFLTGIQRMASRGAQTQNGETGVMLRAKEWIGD